LDLTRGHFWGKDGKGRGNQFYDRHKTLGGSYRWMELTVWRGRKGWVLEDHSRTKEKVQRPRLEITWGLRKREVFGRGAPTNEGNGFWGHCS